MIMAVWDAFLTEQDKAVRELYGSKNMGWGKRPVVFVIDVNYNFTGDKREPILESMKRWRNSCGQEGWDAAIRAGRLVEAARRKRIPIMYTTEMDQRADGWDSGRRADKNARRKEDRARDQKAGASGDGLGINVRTGKEIHESVQPQAHDIFIGKKSPSAFFGTLAASYLVELQADSLILAGSTTSGCVRATVIDGFSHFYRMFVVEECTFDRFQASHAMELFAMQMKYADVVGLDDTIEYLDGLPEGLFDEQMPVLRALAPTAAPR
jgi:nicotinamidase-related amidase